MWLFEIRIINSNLVKMTSKELNMGELSILDKQIETLMECKPLAESDVK